MKILLQLQKAHKSFGPRVLFNQASFVVNSGEHIGVIGANGAGKTTLFKCLVRPDLLDGGQLITANGLRLGYLAQEEHQSVKDSVRGYLESHCLRPLWELEKLSEGLGLTATDFDQPMEKLSGGYQMRVKLLSLLGNNCDLLLLDEPTNYLDLESLIVLENFLQNYEGAFLLISHDREFLRRTTDHTLEVEAGELTKFNGHIDDYFEQKRILQATLEKQALSQEAKRKEILEFANRFRAQASKAKQVQSRLKRLDKMEDIQLKSLPVRAKIQIPEPVTTGKEALSLEEGELGYPRKTVLQNVHVKVLRGDHVGIVGVNGAGKSTLLKSMAGQLPPLKGQWQKGNNVHIGYFAQHVAKALDPQKTVHESLQEAAHPDILPQQILDLAGSLLFSDQEINKRISVLSGGEKSRVALGQVLLQRAPILVLDEPTNHLDFHTVEALTQALHSYSGTVVTVSHDRAFISRVATKIFEIRDGQVDIYPGTYDEYVWSLEKGAWGEKEESKPTTQSPSKTDTSSLALKDSTGPNNEGRINLKEQKKKIRKTKLSISELEKDIENRQKTLEELTEKLQEASGPDLNTLSQTLHEHKQQLEQLEEQWLNLQNDLEHLESLV